MIDEIKMLRKELHRIPEASMQEEKTKAKLMDFIHKHTSLAITDCGSWFYVWKDGTKGNRTIGFRADFDAVVCQDGCARHLCGHDGHSAILAGFALYLDGQTTDENVCLIFQPGEETGQGGATCSRLITEKNISEIYAIHNIPGHPEGDILLLNRTFACASTGMEIEITGTPSHAAYPEQGKNPALIIAELIQHLNRLIAMPHKGIVLGTVIGIDLGSKSYGVSAEKGTLRLTLRAEYQDEYDELTGAIQSMAETLSMRDKMKCQVRRIEEFPATENTELCVKKVRHAAESIGLKTIEPSEPFRWSEDFGYYLKRCDGAIFGVGCGENHPGLHTFGYEFNDAIIGTTIQMYMELLKTARFDQISTSI